jgi:predicted AAA+ superfamily ATPase
MEDTKYIPRLFDETLAFALKSKGAVLVVGPKSCGKSTTSKRQAKTIIDLTDIHMQEQQISLAKASPSKFLSQGERPLLIDEWQVVSFIWNSVKYEVDKSNSFGQFILTGSVTDKTDAEGNKDENRHTGTARIIRKIMRPMSLFESGDSNGEVSLLDLKEGKFEPSASSKTIDDYAYFICRGGWPLAMNREKDVALQQALDFYEGVVTEDLFSLKDIPLRKDEQKARKLMRALSRAVGSQTANKTIMDDVAASDDSFDARTFEKYCLALKRLYVIEDLEAWNPNLRSKNAIREKPTRHFVDPSIAASALGVGPEGLFKDMKTFGFLFESLAIRDLRIYCDTFGAQLYHFKDSEDRESDAVIYFRDGSWALIEVKLGDKSDIDKGAKNLLKIAADIDTEKTGAPAFLMVITKNNVAIRREDGVYEVPLACLRP